MRTADQWLDEYGESHRNHANKALHWICVPMIAWCVLGLLWSLPFPANLRTMHPGANWAGVAVLAAMIYYSALSLRLALGVLPLLLAFLWSIAQLDHLPGVPLWRICVFLFVVAWIGQVIGQERMPKIFSNSSSKSSGSREGRSILLMKVKIGIPRIRQTSKSLRVCGSTPFAASINITAASAAINVR